jgi:hypothetical protein
MAVSVDIFVKDTQPVPQPVSGVVVNVYDASTLAFVTSGVTDGAGQAALLLPGDADGIPYEVRFYKQGVSFQNPMAILVKDPLGVGETNEFDASGQVKTLAEAVDPLLCRVTAQLIGMDGKPMKNVLIKLFSRADIESQNPLVLNDRLLTGQSFEVKTDENGEAIFDLIRKGEYFTTFAGNDDTVWNFVVPDRSSVRYADLVHPQPVSLDWDNTDAPGDAVSVGVGGTIEVDFSVLFSDFQSRRKDLGKYITLVNSDDTKMDVKFYTTEAKAVITGLAPGMATVTAEIKQGIVPARIPDYSITSPALNVTITP